MSSLCSEGRLNLTKFSSKRYPKKKEAHSYQIWQLESYQPCRGIKWDIENYAFGFNVNFTTKSTTRRIVSQLSSAYDPCGYVASLLLKGRRIIQSTCKMNLSWDDSIPDTLKDDWANWCVSFKALSNFQIERYFGQLHVSSLLRCFVRIWSSFLTTRKIHCAVVMSKSRVTPLKNVSMPRLELAAATLSTKS